MPVNAREDDSPRPPPRSLDLPVMALQGGLRAAMRDPGAAVLVAPTGSGKTTGVPILLAEDPSFHERIVVLQPRRLATLRMRALVIRESEVAEASQRDVI